jgi:hypothetical protein
MIEHARTTPAGRALGFALVQLTNPTIFRLSLEGEPDTRCKSCALTLGTVPNGCPQTMMDAFKAVIPRTSRKSIVAGARPGTVHGKDRHGTPESQGG